MATTSDKQAVARRKGNEVNQDFYNDEANKLPPERTALIIVDMQNDFGHQDGYLGDRGLDVSSVSATIPALEKLIDAARQAGVLVVWTMNENLPAGRSDSPAWLAHKGSSFALDAPTYTLKGSWGQEFMEPFKPRDDEPVVVKYRSTAFDHTAMDLILRANGIQRVVVCGTATDGCVEATVRSAAFHEYYTQIVSDCVSSTRPSMHDASLRLFQTFFGLQDSQEFVSRWATESSSSAASGTNLRATPLESSRN